MKYCVFPLGSWNGFDIVLPTRLLSTAVLYRIGSNGVRDRVPAAKMAGGACALAPDVEDERSVGGGAYAVCFARRRLPLALAAWVALRSRERTLRAGK